MSNVLEVIGAAMRAEAETLRVISQNVANAQTPAYRRQIPIARTQFEDMVNATPAELRQLTPVSLDVAVDMQPATLKGTGEPLNLALDGSGFFVLQSSRGETLTRRGDFHVDDEGALVSSGGARILGDKGPIHVGIGVVTVSPSGDVAVNDQLIDRIRVVNVLDSTRLTAIGDGSYVAALQDVVEGDLRPAVRQGFLETSNVVPMHEVVQLMETLRRFEAEQKFARAYDGMLDSAISELGKVG